MCLAAFLFFTDSPTSIDEWNGEQIGSGKVTSVQPVTFQRKANPNQLLNLPMLEGPKQASTSISVSLCTQTEAVPVAMFLLLLQ
jgi:hypothetical protein